MQMKGNLDGYLKAIEEEIERLKHQRLSVPGFCGELIKHYDEQIKLLEQRQLEACLLIDFEEDEQDE
jgi:hypothetical protein